jgi:hypothetical protein
MGMFTAYVVERPGLAGLDDTWALSPFFPNI